MTNNQFRDDLRKTYDLQANLRDASSIQEWKVEERASFLSLLQKEDKQTLLEIGSGPGRDGEFFQKQGLQVTCIDLSPEMIRLCHQKGLTAYVMDMTNLTFANNSFDAVYTLNSLLHLTKAELPAVLRQIHSLLKPAGLFFMGVYGGDDFEGTLEDDPSDPKRFFSYFTDEHIQKVVSQVFDILSFRQIPVQRADNRHFQSLVLKKSRLSVSDSDSGDR
ncbi:MAG: class I SAM-dependent methyltransferase [Dehalococcoidales bacterium]|nr:MAG: class I SAM-dependent methyltransferase [Dehalococcoidales bacterium]